MEGKLNITIMDGILDDKAISGDIICIVNIEIDEILEWIDKYKWRNSIHYKGKDYSGKIMYRDVFIFEDRKVLDKFVKSLRVSEDSMEGFIVHDIIYALSSSVGRIRTVKNYNPMDKIESISGMCEFIDGQSFENREVDDILEDRLLIKIDNLNYKYREIYYT